VRARAPSADWGRVGEPPPAPDPLTRPALDSHCHLDLMDVPIDQVVAQARAVGISKVLTVGIDAASSEWQMHAASSYDDVFAAVAIHPNEVVNAAEGDWDGIEALSAHDKVVAIGETGLDHYRTAADGWLAQEESFRRHIDIAKRTGKALVIHDRDAHDDVMRVLEAEGAPEHVVFHCFSGDEKFASRCVDAGHVLSFAGNITFKNADDLRAAARVTPLEQMLVETDAPFLTPMPYRGRPNAPYLVPLTVRAIAAVKAVDADEISAGVCSAARTVFGFG
jgi:TatD DNase family protein